LRELGDDYTYSAFMKQLEEKKKDMNPAQKAGLRQRLDLLQTFTRQTRSLPSANMSRNTVVMREEERFAPGMITIIDLSDPFVDPPLAGAIFEICIRLFQRASVDTGKVLVVDEAHKVLVVSLLQYSVAWGLTHHVVPLRLEQPYWPHAGTTIAGSSATTHVNARGCEHARFVLKRNMAP
jgi:hypothetical protein